MCHTWLWACNQRGDQKFNVDNLGFLPEGMEIYGIENDERWSRRKKNSAENCNLFNKRLLCITCLILSVNVDNDFHSDFMAPCILQWHHYAQQKLVQSRDPSKLDLSLLYIKLMFNLHLLYSRICSDDPCYCWAYTCTCPQLSVNTDNDWRPT